MKSASKLRCIANMPKVIEGNGGTCTSAASIISKLIAPFTYSGTMKGLLIQPIV